MDNENLQNETSDGNNSSELERLNALAEKRGISAEELLNALENENKAPIENSAANNQSTGSQNSTADNSFDPTGTEFLKGIWSK